MRYVCGVLQVLLVADRQRSRVDDSELSVVIATQPRACPPSYTSCMSGCKLHLFTKVKKAA
jgi:hypothetical protein